MLKSYQRITNALVNWINRLRHPGGRVQNALAPRGIRTQFVKDVRYAASKSFVLIPLAEASQRFSKSSLVAVPLNVPFSEVAEDNLGIFLLNQTTSLTNSIPPKHFDLHKKIYTNTSSKAILLCHPVEVYRGLKQNAFHHSNLTSLLQEKFPNFVITNGEMFEDDIQKNNLVLLPDVGVFSHADNLRNAVDQIELYEWFLAISK